MRQLVMMIVAMLLCLSTAYAEDIVDRWDDRVSVLPASLQVIDDEAFAGTALQVVVTNDELTAIGERAFADNDSLVLFVASNDIETISDDAFENDEKLTIIGEWNGFIADWAQAHGIAFVDIVLLRQSALLNHRYELLIIIILIIAIIACSDYRSRLGNANRFMRSMRRWDRPEMAVPEAVIP